MPKIPNPFTFVVVGVVLVTLFLITYSNIQPVVEEYLKPCCTNWSCPYDTSGAGSLFGENNTVESFVFQNNTYYLGDVIWLDGHTTECQKNVSTGHNKIILPYPLYLDNVSRECVCRE